jgi:glucose-1-phosphate thymidylyltransferase
MNAIILAAGFCTRLFPITEYFPKGLLPIHGKAIISYLLDDLATIAEINSIQLVTNNRYAQLFDYWVNSYYPNLHIQIINNTVTKPENRFGAIGDLLYTLNQNQKYDDILVLASDTLASLKLKNLVRFYKNNRGVVNVIFNCKNLNLIKKRLGCVVVEGAKIVSFEEKPEQPMSTLTSIPYYIYPKEYIQKIFDYQKSGGSLDAPGSIISWLIGQVPVFGFDIGGGFYYDVGTIETYNRLAGSPEL